MALFTDNDTRRSHRSQFHDVGKGEHYHPSQSAKHNSFTLSSCAPLNGLLIRCDQKFASVYRRSAILLPCLFICLTVTYVFL